MTLKSCRSQISVGPLQTGIRLQTFIFGSHIAALEPLSGMGVLVLPDFAQPIDAWLVRLTGERATTIARRCQGLPTNIAAGVDPDTVLDVLDTDDNSTAIRCLDVIGRDWHGKPTCSRMVDAGATDCCGPHDDQPAPRSL